MEGKRNRAQRLQVSACDKIFVDTSCGYRSMDCGTSSGRYGKGYDGHGGSRISLVNVPDFSWRCNVDQLYGRTLHRFL